MFKTKNNPIFKKNLKKDIAVSLPHDSSRQKIVRIAEPLMTVVGISGQFLFYLQAYKIYSIECADDISAIGFCFSLFSQICWTLYGILIRNKVLFIVSAFGVVGISLTLLAIFFVS